MCALYCIYWALTCTEELRALDGVHLKQCVTLYLFALPMALVNDFGWGTVPVVTAIAFTFMGIEGIADEIEMPFGL